MFFPLFISMVLIGAVLLVALITFAHRRAEPARSGHESPPSAEEEGGSPDAASDRETPFGSECPPRSRARSSMEGLPETRGFRTAGSETAGSEAAGSETGSLKTGGDVSKPGGETERGSRGRVEGKGIERTIPVLEPGKTVPGLGRYELVHFFSRARMYTLEDAREPREVQVDESRLKPEVEGELAVTSKKLILFDDKTVKKLPFGVIESHHFGDGLLVLKKKNVKKKKTAVKIFGNFDDFQYILDVVLHT